MVINIARLTRKGLRLLGLILCLTFVGISGGALAAPVPTGPHDGIEILAPQDGQILSSVPVPVNVKFQTPIRPGSFEARLNGRDVSARFSVGSDTATASLGVADGVKISTEKNRYSNVLQVWMTDAGTPSHRYHAERTFFVGGSLPGQVSGVISPAGGSLLLPGVGQVTFPAGAFAADTTVVLSVSQGPDVQQLFDQTAIPMFDAANRLPYELRVTTGSVQPLQEPHVSFFLPGSYLAGVSSGSEVRVFAEDFWDDVDEALDTLEVLPDRFTASDTTVTVSMPVYFFTDSVRADGKFELTALVATTPTAPGSATSSSSLSSVAPLATVITSRVDALVAANTFGATASACNGSTLSPPLDGTLEVTSPFGLRKHPITGKYQGHSGTDYRAATGTPVKSMADGVVEKIGNDTRTVNGKTIGWGQYVVVRHTDGSKTLYAHLDPGSAVAVGTKVKAGDHIADSDTTGGATGPHLHAEYAPNGKIYDKASKVDPAPCIGGNITGSITVRDNGNLADDAFSVSIDGLVVCTTSIGASNTCAVGNLRPGTKTLILTAVIAPDDVGTYEITLGNGLTFSGGGTQQSGVIPQGGSVTYTIIVPSS